MTGPGTGVRRFAMALVAVCLAGSVALACDEPRSSPRPSASLLEVEFTPQPTATSDSSAAPSDAPTFVAIPVGWDNAFCAVFADAFVAQELVIDVQRALDEDAVRDARALARELRDITADAAALLPELPDWDPGEAATLEIAALIDLGSRAGIAYGEYFETEERGPLRRARALRREVGDNTPAANEALAELAQTGIVCEGFELRLEEF